MKHKNIPPKAGKLLLHFHQKQQECFDFSEARDAFSESQTGALKELLSDMVRRGLLLRLKKGLYYIIPFEADSETYLPDWHTIATLFVKDTDHYIGYYSALQIHGLITQPSLHEQVVVSKQVQPTQIHLRGVNFQFITHSPSHFFGFKKIWVDNFTQVLCSDLEKTLIDCLFRPDYAGGVTEIAKAIYISRDEIQYDTLLQYALKFSSQAVIKRLGFLLELLGLEQTIINQLYDKRSTSYTLLDTELPKSGKMSSRWRIQQNLDTETIISGLYT